MDNNEKIKMLKNYLKEMKENSQHDFEIAVEYGDNFSQGYTEGLFAGYQDIYKFLEKLEREGK